MTEKVHDLTTVLADRREPAPESPSVTLTARVSLGNAGDVRLLVRPVVALMADGSGRTLRTEMHVEGGSSVILEGPPLAALFDDSLRFLKDAASGVAAEHDHVFGLETTFDIAAGPFVTFEQPAFLVASARTFIHESGAAVLRILGEMRATERAAHHAPALEDNPQREAFDLQIQARRGAWLVSFLENALADLRGATTQVDVKRAEE